ncbi:MAG: hypothetical protein IIW92_12710 [Lachnospiraceae bacterium]|nr:hypothetical protein [Lachnospiraceae bacterium]MBQ5919416.1 hypothetical protein [Lachnospiraceae bacterium]
MKYYLYDEKTKQFIKEQEGYLDPLETKAQGKNVYLVPPFSTTERPDLTSLKDNEILVFKDNKWQVEQEFYVGKIVDCQGERVSKYVTDNDLTFEKCDDGFKIVEKYVKEKTLEELREQKLNELSSQASRFEQTENKDMFLTSSLGFRINADPKAKRNIDTLIEVGVTTFRDYDNVIHANVSLEDLTTIKREISINAIHLYNQKWQMEYQISTLKTIEEVENYQIQFEMLNFNNWENESEVSE